MVLKESSIRRINVLSPGFLTANSQGFLYPLLINRELLRERNLHLKIYSSIKEDIGDCDFLLIDSKYFKLYWGRDSEKALEIIAKLSNKVGSLLWFHTGDSAGVLGTYCKSILPFVKGVYKSQTYVDKTIYQKPLYGNRFFTDYYHKTFGIEDDEIPEPDSVLSEKDLTKIKLSWNIGYARCFHYFGEYVASMYKHIPSKLLLRIPPKIYPASKHRIRGVYSRMALNFSRRTIGYQRASLAKLLGRQARVSRRLYYKEMKESKIVVSPFGWGEINNRDFEAFIYGCLLVKPSMEYLQTYPRFFSEGVTYIPYQLDLSDMKEVIEDAESNYSNNLDIAIEGQERYIRSTISRDGREEFVNYFSSLLDD